MGRTISGLFLLNPGPPFDFHQSISNSWSVIMSSLNVLGFGWLDLPLLPFSLSDKANENGAICLLWPRGVDNTCIYMYVRDVWPGHMAEPSPPDRCCHRLNALQIICSLSKFAPRNWVIATMAGGEKWPLIPKKLWNSVKWHNLRVTKDFLHTNGR